jgi:hypothetical protein
MRLSIPAASCDETAAETAEGLREGPQPVTLDRVMGRIRAWRRAQEIGVKALAKAAAVSSSIVTAVEHGRPVSGNSLLALEALVPGDYAGYTAPVACEGRTRAPMFRGDCSVKGAKT